VLQAVRHTGGALVYASPKLRATRAIVLEAVRQCGRSLEVASEAMRADREVVLEAVQQDGFALEFASDLLRSDREVVLAAVRVCGCALEHADPVLKNDKEIVLEAVDQHGLALESAGPLPRADREIVLAAVSRHGGALRFAPSKMKKDREVVLEAVRRSSGSAWKHAETRLKADPLLDPCSACLNPIATPGSAGAPVFTVLEVTVREVEALVEMLAISMTGMEVRVELPVEATVGDFGRRLVEPTRHRTVYMVLLGHSEPLSPFDVDRPFLDVAAHLRTTA